MKILDPVDVGFLFSITLFSILPCGSREQLDTPRNKMTFTEAEVHCRASNRVIMGGSSPDDENKMRDMMLSNEWKVAWTQLQIRRFKALLWINESSVPGRTFDEYDAKCGAIDLFDNELYEYPCDESRHFLCEIQGCEKCPVQKSSAPETCISIDTSCYISSSSMTTWFKARNICTAQGGDLAVIDTNANLDDFSHNIWLKYGIKSLWLGLRTTDWKADGHKAIVYSWLDGQPNIYQDCVVLTRRSNTYGWQTYPCGEKAYFFCKVTETLPLTPSQYFKTSTLPETEEKTEESVSPDEEDRK